MTSSLAPAVNATAQRCDQILTEIERIIVGKRTAVAHVLLGILASGHILIEDLPGLGKTLLARSFATALGLEFTRVQFTPDMLPSDLTGAPVLDPRTGGVEFRPGPVFTNLLLGDEINRTPPKTQAALLEAMAEGQVSVDGHTHPLPQPFVVLATDNPIEYEGTYPLPEAQLDRFTARIRLGYLDRGGRGGDGPAAAGPRFRATSGRSRSWTPSRCWPCGSPWSRSTWMTTCSGTSSAWSPPPATTRRSRSGPARAARWR